MTNLENLWVEYDLCVSALEKFPQNETELEIIDANTILKAHFAVVEFAMIYTGEGIGGVGPRSNELLLSAIDRQYISFSGKIKWKSIFDKIATLMYGVVKNHPFYDANKRTALLSCIYGLFKRNYYLKADKNDVEDLIVQIADDSLHLRSDFLGDPKSEDDVVVYIGGYLKKNSRKINKKLYFLTFRELSSKLREYGYEMKNPSGNYIDVVRMSDGKRLSNIGFPGWTKQMELGPLNSLLEKLELTPENGFDSEVIFHGNDPVFSFVTEYKSQLISLSQR